MSTVQTSGTPASYLPTLQSFMNRNTLGWSVIALASLRLTIEVAAKTGVFSSIPVVGALAPYVPDCVTHPYLLSLLPACVQNHPNWFLGASTLASATLTANAIVSAKEAQKDQELRVSIRQELQRAGMKPEILEGNVEFHFQRCKAEQKMLRATFGPGTLNMLSEHQEQQRNLHQQQQAALQASSSSDESPKSLCNGHASPNGLRASLARGCKTTSRSYR